jgi:cell shape-determining protein MreD
MLDAIKIAILVFVLAVLQVSFFPAFLTSGGGTDVLCVLVVFLAMQRGLETAAVTGFFAGLLIDAMLFDKLGVSSLLYMIAGAWVASRTTPDESAMSVPARGGAVSMSAWRQLLYVVAGVVIVQVGYALLQVLLGDSYPAGFVLRQVIFPTVVQTTVVALLLLPLLRRLFPLKGRFDVSAIAAA